MWTRFVLWILTCLGRDPRGLFSFFDGRRWRSVDPLVAAREFFALPDFDWDETPELLKSGRAVVQLQTIHVIARAVRKVLDIPPVERGGLSERECLEVLAAFRLYLGDVKKNGSLFPILPDSTESAASVDLPIPTKPGSVSGSMQTVPSPGPPGSPAGETIAS